MVTICYTSPIKIRILLHLTDNIKFFLTKKLKFFYFLGSGVGKNVLGGMYDCHYYPMFQPDFKLIADMRQCLLSLVSTPGQVSADMNYYTAKI